MPKLHGSADSEIKPTERRKEEEVYNPQPAKQSTKSAEKRIFRQKRLLFASKVLSLQTE